MSLFRLCWVAVLLLAACAPAEPEGPSPAELVKAEQGVADYLQLRQDGQFERAEARADALLKRYPDSGIERTLRQTLPDTRQQAEVQREQRRLADLWDYQRIPVTGGEQRTAALYSVSETDPEAEVVPVPDARLVLRRHPEWGRSAYLLLNQRAQACPAPCTLQLRFDRGEPQAWRGKLADSGSGPAMFIVEEARFLAAMREAKRLRIELPQSGALVPAFEFELAGFDPQRLDP